MSEINVPERPSGRFPVHSMRRIRTVDGRFLYCDVGASVASAFGLDDERLTDPGGVDHSWVDERDRAGFVSALNVSADTGMPLDTEARVVMPDGSRKWIRSMGDPVRQRDGSTVWEGVALEVTDRREALERVEQAMDAARAAEAAASVPARTSDPRLREAITRLRGAIGVDGPLGNPEIIRASLLALEDLFDSAHGMTQGAEKRAGQRRAMGVRQAGKDTAHRLTPRQREIVGHIGEGWSNRQIAEHLALAEGTVKLHVSRILKRTGSRNRTQLAVTM